MTPTARAVAGLAFLAFGAAAPTWAPAQQPSAPQASAPPGAPLALTLDEALQLGERRSESVRIAEAGVLRARGQTYGRATRFDAPTPVPASTRSHSTATWL